MVRLVVAMGTLLGPEETITRVGVPLWGAGGGFFQGRLAGVSWWMAFARHDLGGIPRAVVRLVLLGGCGLVVG